MSKKNTDKLLAIKDVVRVTQAKPNSSGGWTGHCPCAGHNHGDRNPSLDIKQGDEFPPGFATYICRTQGHSYKEITADLRLKIGNGATAQQQEADQEPSKPEKPTKTAKDFGWPERWQPLSQTTYDIFCKSRPKSYTPRLETLLQFGFREQQWRGQPQIGYPVLYGGELALLKTCPAALPLDKDGNPTKRPWPQYAPDPEHKVPSDLIFPMDLLTFEDHGTVSPFSVLVDADDDESIRKHCAEFYSSLARPCGAHSFLFIVESQWDALALIELGYTAFSFMNAGQEEISKDILTILDAAGDQIFLVPQNDEKAGHELMRRMLKLLPTTKTAIIELPPGVKDICELRLMQTDEQVHATLSGIVEAMTVVQQQEAAVIHSENTIVVEYPNTDTGNAERLVAAHGHNFRWLMDMERFHVWNGSIWEPSRTGIQLLPWTKEVVRKIPDKEWALSSESGKRRHTMIDLSKGERVIWTQRDFFNQHPMLLTVKNGTLDLETQTLRESRREDFLTAQAPVVYDGAAKCPKFDDFLNFTFDLDETTIHWIDKAMGYTLTGRTGEHIIFICHGSGGNGKTQLFEIMRMILGSGLAEAGRFRTFCESKGGFDQPDYELANFADARLVTASEPSKSSALNEELLKSITGDGVIKARQIRGVPFDYLPQFKLWLGSNTKPRIVGTDEGIWRRVRMIPFTQTVPEDRKIQDYAQTLFREEASGILNRMLRGVRDWIAKGLKPVGAIADATENYRRSQDVVHRFITEACVTGDPNMHVNCGRLHKAFLAWAKEQKETEMSNYDFSQTMQRTYKQDRYRKDGENTKHWYGIALAGE